jgi:NAD(P)-dependent dehydrogenase (short-subunit alcohol dehydrogenase family)
VATTDPVTVVVGAASGIGAAVAGRLADRGPMIVADQNLAGVEEIAADLGPDVRPVVCDITVPDDVHRLAGSVRRLGSLVVTAGISPSMGDAERIFEVSLAGRARVVDAFESRVVVGSVAVVMAAAGAHAVPNIPEIMALLDAPFDRTVLDSMVARGLDTRDPRIGYAFANHGMIRLVRNRAAAWGARGGRILSLSPGMIDTPMGRREARRWPVIGDLVANSPLQRAASPDEIAAVVEFLTSRGASFMTGTDVLVDGGITSSTSVKQLGVEPFRRADRISRN